MFYELRTYTTMPGRLPDLHKRFAEVTLKIFERHGIRQVGFWTTVFGENTNNELIYMLAWESLAEREQKWVAAMRDPEWVEKFKASEANGPLVSQIKSNMLWAAPYSALK